MKQAMTLTLSVLARGEHEKARAMTGFLLARYHTHLGMKASSAMTMRTKRP
jgi:hypothetical protein